MSTLTSVIVLQLLALAWYPVAVRIQTGAWEGRGVSSYRYFMAYAYILAVAIHYAAVTWPGLPAWPTSLLGWFVLAGLTPASAAWMAARMAQDESAPPAASAIVPSRHSVRARRGDGQTRADVAQRPRSSRIKHH